MSIRKRRSYRSGRVPLRSLGRPPVPERSELQRFWFGIAQGMTASRLRWRLVCRSLSEPECSERRAACHQRCSDFRPSRSPDDISRLPNVRRSRFFAFRAFRSARSDAGLVGVPPPSPVSYGATPRRAAAAWNIVHRQPNGMPNDRLGARKPPNLRKTPPCASMSRRGWLEQSRLLTALSWVAPQYPGMDAVMDNERLVDGARHGARSRSPGDWL